MSTGTSVARDALDLLVDGAHGLMLADDEAKVVAALDDALALVGGANGFHELACGDRLG
jgi:hypothetical protein